MIYYFIIFLAVICFTAQFGFTKLYEKTVSPTLHSSLIMVVVTNLVGAILFFAAGGFKVEISLVSLLWALAFAIVMVPYFVIGVKVLSIGSLAIYSIFMMLGGMLVPFLYGVLFLKEILTPGRILGTLLLSVFVVLQAIWSEPGEKHATTKSTKVLFVILCFTIFLLNGMTGVIAKAHEIGEHSVDEMSFTVLYCSFTALLSFVFCLFGSEKIRLELKESLKLKSLIIMCWLGAAAYIGNFLHLKAAGFVPATLQFPLVSGGVIVLSALSSRLLFKEEISKKEWISVAGAFLSTVLFAF